jgi:hypothetical protein
MRLHVDRPCRVWRSGTRWWWRCSVCAGAHLFTGSARSWRRAIADADSHIRTAHNVFWRLAA